MSQPRPPAPARSSTAPGPTARVALVLTVILAVMAAVLGSYWLHALDATSAQLCEHTDVSYGECVLDGRVNRAVSHLLEALTFATGAGAAAALVAALFSMLTGRRRV